MKIIFVSHFRYKLKAKVFGTESHQSLKIPRNIQSTPWSHIDFPPSELGAYSLQRLCAELDSTIQVPELL